MTHRKHYSLSDLMAQCDLSAPMPEAFREWDQMVPVGLEQEITQQAADVILQAIRVFESQELAFDWLQRPIPALDGEKPFDLLGTDEGCSSVTSAIQKIAWGDFSWCMPSPIAILLMDPPWPSRVPFLPELPRTLIHREPDNTLCQCGCQLKRIGEDVSEKLDYVPGEFTVERHIRGKWTCNQCETLVQAPVPPQVIDKGIPSAGLLVQVLVAKYADHLPLYRQERIFGRGGLEIPRSTLAEWVGACGVQLQTLVDELRNTLLEHSVLHADETPVSMLAAGKKKTHKAYVWAY